VTVFDLAPSQPEVRATQAIDLALELADAVKRNHRGDAQCVLDRADTAALCLVLAAMVDDDRSVKQLLRDVGGLLRWLHRPRILRERPLRPCGTHAAWERHKRRGEEPCLPCAEAERAYQRARSRDRRRTA
jgi:hypothetical protein